MPLRRILAVLAAALAAPCFALQAVHTVATPGRPSQGAVDPATGKAYIVNTARLGYTPSLMVADPSGAVSNLVLDSGASHVALAPRQRKAVLSLAYEKRAAIVDLDALTLRKVETGSNPGKSVVDDERGMAYVLGRGTDAGGAPGSVTAIDLRTAEARTFALAGHAPGDIALARDGRTLFVAGARPGLASFVQALDTATGALGEPVVLARPLERLLPSPDGRELHFLGHLADFVLDAATLQVVRAVPLPGVPQENGEAPHAAFARDGTLYVADGASLLAIAPGAATARATALEAPASALAVNEARGTVVVALAAEGIAAIFGLDGTRLDSVPLGRAAAGGRQAPSFVAANPLTGDTFVANTHDNTLSILPGAGAAAGVVNLGDLWYDPAEPGWGVFVDQQGAAIFAALFAHDASGKPEWLFMSNGARQPDGTFAGDLYRARGPLPRAMANVSPVGTMRFSPTGDGATLAWTVGARSFSRPVERFSFNDAHRECRWAVGTPKAASLDRVNFTSLWSNPAEPGWGLAVAHHGDTVFGVLFAYDAENNPSWAVMSNGRRSAPGAYGGELYRASKGAIEPVGSMALAFESAEKGALTYRMDGTTFRMPILRLGFGKLTSSCSQ